MTHTCCYAGYAFTPAAAIILHRFDGDVDGIQDEQQELAGRLESLVNEFQSELDASE